MKSDFRRKVIYTKKKSLPPQGDQNTVQDLKKRGKRHSKKQWRREE